MVRVKCEQVLSTTGSMRATFYTHGAVGWGCTPEGRTEVRLVTFERG